MPGAMSGSASDEIRISSVHLHQSVFGQSSVSQSVTLHAQGLGLPAVSWLATSSRSVGQSVLYRLPNVLQELF
ncbi:hypothetical protein EXIGLDRAFT_730679 [Exidia glandulosa HHB12029]|uniref:Uncharacterized protein n=1 Tax=Exidia glandulosa HHB12029 TaxID=1314781 RepID=A0A165L7F0_EXIGL|nr:hypothetical protein EXIGLDRAFT_730679 [Exidia glandulosa HHB12029]